MKDEIDLEFLNLYNEKLHDLYKLPYIAIAGGNKKSIQNFNWENPYKEALGNRGEDSNKMDPN
jgi:hypothetical protein